MLKGTRVLIGKSLEDYRDILGSLEETVLTRGYQEVIVPQIWGSDTFKQKIQGETLEQMWTFKDKADRDCCLIPEVTGIIQEMYNNEWSKNMPKPIRLFYISKVYRYERPQAGRYREFTQFGVEILGTITDELRAEAKETLKQALKYLEIEYQFNDNVKRGLGYYVANGFEATSDKLGAQKQIAGGGEYAEGIGWAIGVDRLMLLFNSGERSSVG